MRIKEAYRLYFPKYTLPKGKKMEVFTPAMLVLIFTFSFATSITPGPNNIMLLSSGLTFGYQKTVPHLLGVIIGFPLMTLCVGLGLGEVFHAYPAILTLLKVLGTLYLLWLAWKIANLSPSLESKQDQVPMKFMPIILFQWVNPKNWIKIITAMSVYVNKPEEALMQIVVITVIFFSTVLISANTWAMGGVILKRLIKSKRGISIFNVTMAILLVLSIVLSFYENR